MDMDVRARDGRVLSLARSRERDPGEALRAIAETVTALGRERGWSPKLTYRVNLVLDELVSNTCEHGCRPGQEETPEVEIRIECGEEAIEIEMIDDGVAFDSVGGAPKAKPIGAESVPIGGLGLHLVRNMTRSMGYERQGNRNHLKLTVERE